MAFETLLLDHANGIAKLTLNRPQVLNALNAKVFDELEQAFTELAANDEVRVILLTGQGEKAFAAGADIKELSAADTSLGELLSRRGQGVFRQIETCGKPVIALINGFALGGGCELAMACIMRIASENAKLGLPEIKLGLIPGYGGTQRLPQLVGTSAALKMILTGEMVGAAEALRLGLVDEVVAADRLMARGEELAGAIAGGAPLAVKAALEALRKGAGLGIEDGTVVEAEIFGRLCGTADMKEGTSAFLAKRKAVWTGK